MIESNTTNEAKIFWKSAFEQFVRIYGKAPSSVYRLAKFAKRTETDFYAAFNGLLDLERNFWKEWLTEVTLGVMNSPEYESYSNREKNLAFAFGWFQWLGEKRDLAVSMIGKSTNINEFLLFDDEVKTSFLMMAAQWIESGKETGEVHSRWFSDNIYQNLCWYAFFAQMIYWAQKDQPPFEKTDALIEKTVNLCWDLLSVQPIDRLWDLRTLFFEKNGLLLNG